MAENAVGFRDTAIPQVRDRAYSDGRSVPKFNLGTRGGAGGLLLRSGLVDDLPDFSQMLFRREQIS